MEDRNRYQTSHVADQLGVSVSTVRRLCARYADALSEDATPRPGGRRQFTGEDIAALREANRLTLAGMDESEIAKQLASVVTLPASTMPPEPPQQPPQLPTLSFDTTSLEKAIERQAAVQQVSIDVMRESNASMDKHSAALERLANAVIIFGAMLLVIALLTIAVASGWIV